MNQEAKRYKTAKHERREAERQRALREGQEPVAREDDLVAALAEVVRLRRAIAQHRAAVRGAGAVRVVGITGRRRAQAKHEADRLLWQEADDAA